VSIVSVNPSVGEAGEETAMSRGVLTEDQAAAVVDVDGEAGAESSAGGGFTPGGSGELLRLALPLVLSQSFMTVQVFVDTLLLARHDSLEMAASFPAVMWFWLPFGLLQVTAGYVSTFVAQYTGAGRP
jgi:MATE family multidrug resistance protein